MSSQVNLLVEAGIPQSVLLLFLALEYIPVSLPMFSHLHGVALHLACVVEVVILLTAYFFAKVDILLREDLLDSSGTGHWAGSYLWYLCILAVVSAHSHCSTYLAVTSLSTSFQPF